MINGLFDNTTIPILSEATSFAQARHNVLAGNLANLDVPGYQVRDLSTETFQERLAEAIQASRETHQPLTGGLMTGDSQDPMQRVRDSMKAIVRHDDVNVGIEHQVLEISKNQFLHNMAITVMGSQFRLLQTVISERL
jgi:flagellar basal-body rod protein FlgB